MNEYLFHIWFAIAFCHIFYISVKIIPHLKVGYGHYFWLGLWIYKPSVLDERGVKLRKVFLLATPVYFLVGVLIAPA